jgi:hypothetical protein
MTIESPEELFGASQAGLMGVTYDVLAWVMLKVES